MTVVLGPAWAYEQRDKLVTLQWSELWDVISLQTLCWEIADKSRSWNKFPMHRTFIIIVIIIIIILGYCQCLLGLIIEFTVLLYSLYIWFYVSSFNMCENKSSLSLFIKQQRAVTCCNNMIKHFIILPCETYAADTFDFQHVTCSCYWATCLCSWACPTYVYSSILALRLTAVVRSLASSLSSSKTVFLHTELRDNQPPWR